MSNSKFGYLLKEDYDSDARWEMVKKAAKKGKSLKEITSLIRQINLSWGMSWDETEIKKIRGCP